MILQILKAGQQTFALSGSHFRVIEAEFPVSVTFEGRGQSQTVKLERGMAFEPDGGFSRVLIVSDNNQKIEVEATLGSLKDNRISGEITTRQKVMNGLLIREEPLTSAIDLVVSESSTRLRLTLKNTGLELVNIGSQSDLVSDSYPLSTGEKVTFDVSASAGIYATSTLGSSLSIIEEFETFNYQVKSNYVLDENGQAVLDENGNYILS